VLGTTAVLLLAALRIQDLDSSLVVTCKRAKKVLAMLATCMEGKPATTVLEPASIDQWPGPEALMAAESWHSAQCSTTVTSMVY
jgi:hypothetical protein